MKIEFPVSLERKKDYIPSLNLLRGISAISVAVFHFIFSTAINNGTHNQHWLVYYTCTGMHLFFMISGFIIPYSMFKAGYRLENIWGFLAKRAMRIEPPYLLSIVLAIGVAFVSTLVPGYQGVPFKFDFIQLALHLGYLVRIFNYEWINEVYWSLGVEFEFYLLCALLFPLLTHRNPLLFSIPVLFLMAGHYYLPNHFDIFTYCFQFIDGIIVFRLLCEIGNRWVNVALLFAMFAQSLHLDIEYSVFTEIFGCLAILFLKKQWKLTDFFGKISYSLYLTHHIIGMRIMNYGSRFNFGSTGKSVLFFSTLLFCILFAWVFYLIIEKPSLRWAARLKYGKKGKPNLA